ncbi:acetylglutamate kinase [Rossellomorea marisflavi]|nr:acetylglutamate kinase [Rossellomorea marisflavi]
MTTSRSMQATARKATVVVKVGGSVISQLPSAFIDSIASMTEDYHVVIVHGGGPEINGMLDRLGIRSTFINGQRKTTDEVFEVAEQMLKGKVNGDLTHRFNHAGVKAVGVCGYDNSTLLAEFLDEGVLGRVGKVVKVNTDLLEDLLSSGYVPVVTPLAVTSGGVKVNVNADLGASAIAAGLGAERLLLVTDVPGILKDGDLIQETSVEGIRSLVEEGTIYGGMIPKVEAAVSTLGSGMKEVMIVGGKGNLYEEGNIVGTKIIQAEGVNRL